MDIVASPFITVILNMVASVLVSRGILDSHSVVAFVQLGNNLIAGVMTVSVAIYSIYKMVDLQKHKLSVATPAASMPVSQVVSTPATHGQSGLPVDQKSNPTLPQNPS